MVLVDTSIWVEHFAKGNAALSTLLETTEVYCHPFVIGELACGYLQKRNEILQLLQALPKTTVAEEKEIFVFIENHRLYGLGIGLIDVHLLASAALSKIFIWTFDKKLSNIAGKLNILYQPV